MRRWVLAAALALVVGAVVAHYVGPRPDVAVAVDMAEASGPVRGGPSSVSLVGVQTRTGPSDAGRFEGRVVSASTGAGVAGAELTFSAGELVATTLTDVSGAFVFEPTTKGPQALAGIVAKGFSPYVPEQGTVHLEARAGQVLTGLFFQLVEEHPLDVSVTEGAAPLSEVVLSVRTPGTLAIAPPRGAKTHGDGTAQLSASEGDIIEATLDGFDRVAHLVTGSEARAGHVAIAMTHATGKTGSVSGTVLDEEDHPLDGVQVVVLAGEASIAETITSTDGAFSLPGTGRVRVRATRAPYVPDEQTVDAGAAPVTLHLRNGCSIHGRVSDRSAPVASFTVVVQRVAGKGPVPASPTVYDAQGLFEVHGVTPGRFALQVLAAGFAPSKAQVVEVPQTCGTLEASFSLGHGGTVFGRVTDGATGQPLAANISMEGFIDTGSSPVNVKSSATTDASGRFEVGGLPAGRRSIVASSDGHHGRIMGGIDVTDGERTGPIDIALDAPTDGEPIHFQLTGIGAVLAPGDGAATVIRAIPGSGADQAGLAAGDQIVTIDGTEVRNMGFDDAMQAIRGPENTTVALGVIKKGDSSPTPLKVLRKVIR